MKILCWSMICILLFNNIDAFHINSETIESMDAVSEKAQEYEMNVILYELGYNEDYQIPNYWQDAYDFSEFVEPLGEYSEEALQKYTSDDISVEIEYLYNRNGSVDAEDGKAMLLQIYHIYKSDEEVVFGINTWGWNYFSADPLDKNQIGEINVFIFNSIREERNSGGADSTLLFERTVL